MAKAKKKSGDDIELVIPDVLRDQAMPRFQDGRGSDKYPLLLSLLSPVYDDKGRLTWESAKITFTVKTGFLKATIVCPTRQCQTTVTLASVVDCWDTLEQAIGTGELTWEETYDRIKEEQKLLKAAKKELAKKP